MTKRPPQKSFTSPSERLAYARAEAGYASTSDAARAMGVPIASYTHHENGTRSLARAAARYARFFHVSLDWLIQGRGDMRSGSDHGLILPVTGLVGAGAAVEQIGDTAGWTAPDEVDLPSDGNLAALLIRGESQYPRFLNGEYIVYDTRPARPETLIGRYAVVQTADGRRLVKRLHRGRGDNRWNLWSHNADLEQDVELIGAWRYIATLPAK